jgi:hypothetical protein
MITHQFEGRPMRRFRRSESSAPLSDLADAKDLVDLAARMGIPPEDAVRHAAQLITEANHAEVDAVQVQAAPRS